MTGRGPYLDRLAERMARTRTALCLGMDPDPRRLPVGFHGLEGLEAFCRTLLAAALPHASALKPNLAFFEAHGSAGLAVLERLLSDVPRDVPVLLDAKRGDIGSTSDHHAAALFDHLGADAVTASPYLGAEAIEPLLARSDRFVYVLCRTSNPGAGELQDLEVSASGGRPAEPLHLRVASVASGWAERYGTVGLVVGATAPDELQRIRAEAPALPFLVPGVGSQGGDVAAALEHGAATDGPAADVPAGAVLVNVSRAIADAALAAPDGDLEAALAAAARDRAAQFRV